MKHIARVGKEWKRKSDDKRMGAALELAKDDTINNYTMVKIERKPIKQQSIIAEPEIFGRKGANYNAKN